MQAKAIGDENKDIWQENAQLQAENMELQQRLLCGTCRDPNEKWHLLNENAKLKDTKRRAQEYLIKVIHVAKIPYFETLEHLESASLNLVPFTDDDCSTNQDTLLSYTERALYEFTMLARKGEPMWLPATNGKILNDQEYIRTLPGLLGPCPQGFVMEGTKGTTLVRGTAFDLVCLLTDVVRFTCLYSCIPEMHN